MLISVILKTILCFSFEIKFLDVKYKFRALFYGDKNFYKLLLYFPKKRKKKIYYKPARKIKVFSSYLNTYKLTYKKYKPKIYKIDTLIEGLKFHPNMISVTIYQPIFYWKNRKRHIKSLILEYNFPAIIWLERRTYAGKFGRYKVYRTYLYKWDFIVYYYLKGKEPLSMYIIQDKKRNRMYLIDVQNNICWNLRYIYPVRCNIETY